MLRKTELGPGETLAVVCPRDVPTKDPVCVYATRNAKCHDLGTRLTECELTVEQQAAAGR